MFFNKNKHEGYRGKECMKKFLRILKKTRNEKKIIIKRKKIKLLTKDQYKSYQNSKICYICKEKFENKYFKEKEYGKVRDHCNKTGEYRGRHKSYVIQKKKYPKKLV